mmetsp:Transcript_50720/g.127360  ORF Transcript_50720/g.127360 Transcript_50720/m.127360 type:complete len:230 (-) Transcript_50720:18-707(-)
MHANESTLAYVQLQQCQLIEVVECRLLASCFECDADGVEFRGLRVPCERTENCRQCHARLRLSSSGLAYQKETRKSRLASAAEAPAPRRVSSGSRRDNNPLIQVGRPLPNNGTCRHYSKSTRWFRFPCCGRAYPCDVCHEDQSPNCPPDVHANRILCGYCAKEQAASEKVCVNCAAAVGGARLRTRHWEAGRGCRDPNRMSRKDSRKYQNLAKTHSRKHTRVGPKKVNK